MQGCRLLSHALSTLGTLIVLSQDARVCAVTSYKAGAVFPHGYQVAWAIVGLGHLEKGSSLTTKSRVLAVEPCRPVSKPVLLSPSFVNLRDY